MLVQFFKEEKLNVSLLRDRVTARKVNKISYPLSEINSQSVLEIYEGEEELRIIKALTTYPRHSNCLTVSA
jgi:hypothetical protein